MEDAKSLHDYLRIIEEIEFNLFSIKNMINENPFFFLSPTNISQFETWQNKVKKYNLTKFKLKTLFNSGFTILDTKLQRSKQIFNLEPFSIFTKHKNLILDKDYGLILMPPDAEKTNFYLNQFELERYTTHYPFLKKQLSNIFSIGAYRANRILKDRENFEPIEIQVNTRKEIEDIIDRIKNKISKTKYELWYRGQDKEYFVKNIHKDVLSLCPWRSIRDVSLIPSIFRTASNLPKLLEKYTAQVFQILKNETLLRLHLSIPAYKNLLSDEKAEKDFFNNKAWSKDNLGFETIHLTNENEIKEKRYFNPILYSIQNALILQHYNIPSNILDITKSLDVALFFAQNELSNSKYIKKENIKECVIYLFIFNPDTDRFIDSTLILNGQKIIRPIRQSCGVISGASISNQNYYARFISLRIKLAKPINYDKNINENYLFPSSLEDPIRDFLEKIK